MTPQVHRLKLSTFNTRGNFPAPVAKKRGEANFLRAFERAYFARRCSGGMAAGEFALEGFGVADMVWVAWKPDPSCADFTAVSLERQLSRRQLFAFEAKLRNWQRALQQAFRYRYFADKAVVIMPAENATAAIANLKTFRHLGVGLWTFDSEKQVIREYFTPTKVKAFNAVARRKAIALLSSKINLRKLRKELQSAL